MEILTPILKLCAGVGLFLFAMYLIEESLKNLSGRNFKRFLQRITKNSLGAVAGGALITGLLQSSSMVSLMVLAFVGAGVFTMKNALAIILGANLGTTLDSWVVATLGFKMNIEVIAYPAVFVGGLLLIIFSKRPLIKYFSFFLLGFGLLFVGLSFMKTAMEAQVAAFDFKQYENMPSIVFLFLGFLITLLVQSSSVTMAITLSALHAGAVTFPIAAAIVLGSETGTTIKILLSGIGGTPAKKRVVLGNFLFNVLITIFAFAFLKQILILITTVFNITNPLIGLVTFSSIVNLISVIIFLPFLNFFAQLLERLFKNSDTTAAAYISHASANEPETALELFRKEASFFIYNVMLTNLEQFDNDVQLIDTNQEFKMNNDKRKMKPKTLIEKYEILTQVQGELQAFYIKLRATIYSDDSAQLNQLISAVRSAQYALKSVHDINSNIDNLSRSSKEIKFIFFKTYQKQIADLYLRLYNCIAKKDADSFNQLQLIYNDIQLKYSVALDTFYKDVKNLPVEDIDLTIVINFNREIYTANKAILMAVKDFLLDEKQANSFNEILVYKT